MLPTIRPSAERDDRHREEVDERLAREPAGLREAADRRDADHDRDEDHRPGDRLDDLDERLGQPLGLLRGCPAPRGRRRCPPRSRSAPRTTAACRACGADGPPRRQQPATSSLTPFASYIPCDATVTRYCLARCADRDRRTPPTRRAPLRRPGPPHRARRAGFRRPARRPARPTGWAVRRLIDRVGARADRLGQRAPARALPAAVQPRRARTTPTCSTAAPTTRRGGCSSTGATRRRCCRSRCSRRCAGAWTARRDEAWGGMRRIQRDRPELVAQVLEEVRARGPVAASEVLEEERPEADRPVVGLERRQARVRVAVLERADHLGAAARVRAPLRPARARAAGGGARRADAAGRGRPARARAGGGALARRRRRARPARLLPAAAGRDAGARGRARRGRRAAGRSRSRAGARPATSIPPRGCRGACTRGRSSARSTR